MSIHLEKVGNVDVVVNSTDDCRTTEFLLTVDKYDYESKKESFSHWI